MDMKKDADIHSPEDAAWEMHLSIWNRTGKTLVLSSVQIPWGVWYRDSTDGNAPITVPAGKPVQALGIRASNGTWTGYECTATWYLSDSAKLPSPLAGPHIKLYIDVPFSAGNTSSLTVNGDLIVEGWSDISKSGHYFDRTIVISMLSAGEHQPNDKGSSDADSRQLSWLYMSNNEMIQDWAKLQSSLEECASFDPVAKLPQAYHYPPTELFVGRSAPHSIAKANWGDLADPIYTQFWQKQEFVDDYFAVEVYTINANPRSTQSVPRGAKLITETSVEVSSSISTTLESNLSLRALFKYEGGGATAELEATYGLKNILEESSSLVERETKTVEIGEAACNRIFVPWVFSTALAVYRKKKDGTVALIGISEWADEIFDQVYDY